MMQAIRRLSLAAVPIAAVVLAAALLPGGADPQPAAEAEDAVLAEGNPPLRQSDVDAWKRLVELAFGAPLSQEQSAALQEQLVAHWREAGDPTRDQLSQARGAWDRLGASQGAQREMLRLALREQLLDAADRHPDDGVSKVVQGLYDAASPVLAEGTPPLRRGSVVALVGIFEWLASRAGGGAAQLTDGEREQFVARLVERYPRTAPGDRMLLQHMEETFAWLQLQWEQAGPQGQANFRTNLAHALGVQGTLPPAPYAGATDTWEHPEGLFTVDYPADWSARYGGLPDGTQVAGWALLDATVLGEAPSAALELAALPEEGALIATATLPADVVNDRLTIEEGVFALAHDMLLPFGAAEPLAQPVAGKGAVLSTWTQQTADGEYVAWLSAVLLAEPRGAAIVTLCRAPASRKADLEPAFSRILYSLRTGDASGKPLADLLSFPSSHDLASDLLNTPLRDQMDMIEGLTSGVR